jgi:hypothetical protein
MANIAPCNKESRIKASWRLGYETSHGLRYGYNLYGILYHRPLEVASRRQ